MEPRNGSEIKILRPSAVSQVLSQEPPISLLFAAKSKVFLSAELWLSSSTPSKLILGGRIRHWKIRLWIVLFVAKFFGGSVSTEYPSLPHKQHQSSTVTNSGSAQRRLGPSSSFASLLASSKLIFFKVCSALRSNLATAFCFHIGEYAELMALLGIGFRGSEHELVSKRTYGRI